MSAELLPALAKLAAHCSAAFTRSLPKGPDMIPPRVLLARVVLNDVTVPFTQVYVAS